MKMQKDKKNDIRCPLCGSREVIKNPFAEKVPLDDLDPRPPSLKKAGIFKCLNCGNEFG